MPSTGYLQGGGAVDATYFIRGTNAIESTFATVRLRTQRTKGCGSRVATLTMVYKLGLEAQKTWRRLNGAEVCPSVCFGLRSSRPFPRS